MQDTREQLIDGARHMFARYGFRRTTVADIAKAAHVVKGAYYHYFKSKEEMLELVVREEMAGVWRDARSAAEACGSSREKLAAFILTSFRSARARANVFAVLGGEREPIPVIEKLREDAMNHQKNILVSLLKEGVEHGEFKTMDIDATAGALATFYGLVVLSTAVFHGTQEEFDEQLKVFLDLISAGIAH